MNLTNLRVLRPLILAAALAVISTQVVHAGGIKWQTDFRKAAAEAARLKKPMLIEVGASWCGYCKKMHRETFTDKKVITQINGCFVLVSLDADRPCDLKQRRTPHSSFGTHPAVRLE